jgi:serine/threonine-protein kinase
VAVAGCSALAGLDELAVTTRSDSGVVDGSITSDADGDVAADVASDAFDGCIASDAGACPSGMIAIPGGCPDEGGVVALSPFCIDATEVTMTAYATCVSAGDCSAAAKQVTRLSWMSDADFAELSSFCNQNDPTHGDHPVNCVRWIDADTFCKKHGKTLPSVEQWAWAAQGAGAELLYPWGIEAPATRPCWSGAVVRRGTCAVGTHPDADLLGYGVHDLAGNGWEFTSSPGPTELGVPTYRVSGGGWDSTKGVLLSRDAPKGWSKVDEVFNNLGFRCALGR